MKRGRKSFKAIEHIAQFNNLRILLDRTNFSENYFRNLLKEHKIICNASFFRALLEIGIIYQKDVDTYICTRNPVHYTELDKAYNIYRQQCMPKNKENAEIKWAIKLLKQAGYKIYSVKDEK